MEDRKLFPDDDLLADLSFAIVDPYKVDAIVKGGKVDLLTGFCRKLSYKPSADVEDFNRTASALPDKIDCASRRIREQRKTCVGMFEVISGKYASRRCIAERKIIASIWGNRIVNAHIDRIRIVFGYRYEQVVLESQNRQGHVEPVTGINGNDVARNHIVISEETCAVERNSLEIYIDPAGDSSCGHSSDLDRLPERNPGSQYPKQTKKLFHDQ
jgi:hypothetical protein